MGTSPGRRGTNFVGKVIRGVISMFRDRRGRAGREQVFGADGGGRRQGSAGQRRRQAAGAPSDREQVGNVGLNAR